MYTVYIYNIRIDIHGMQDIHMVIYIYIYGVYFVVHNIYIYTYIIIFANSMFIHIIIYIYIQVDKERET